MIESFPLPRTGAHIARWCVLLALAPLGCAGNPQPTTSSKQQQLEFGVQMARRGLWNEALFRFQQAEQTAPGDGRLLNNLAVAYEAVGQFDEALAAYQRAVRSAPGDSQIRKNFSRFSQFYESFRPQEEGVGEAGGEKTGAGAKPKPSPEPELGPDPDPDPDPEPEPEAAGEEEPS